MTNGDRRGPGGPHDDLGDLVGEDGDARLVAALDAVADALTQPPDELTAHRHLAAIRAQVASRDLPAATSDTDEVDRRRRRAGRRPMWTRVAGQAATITVALAAASVALATVGALPASAQRAAVDLAERVGVTLPEPERIGPDGTVIPPDLGKDQPTPAPAAVPADPATPPEDGEVAARTGPGLGKPARPPGLDDEGGPGRSDDAPGQTGDAPGLDDDTPDDDAPGNGADAPGQTGDAPGNSADAPGQTGDAPGNSADAPGQTGDAPGLDPDATDDDATDDATDDDAPGNSADAPGQTGDAPGLDTDPEPSGADPADEDDGSPAPPDAPPGQSGDPPDPPAAPPGQADEQPGQSGSAPGRDDVPPGPPDETPAGPRDRPERPS